MKILVKICGVRTVAAAKAAQKGGADFLGFNFVPTSKRRVSPEEAKRIIASLPKKGRPKLVGVFQDASLSEVRHTMKYVGLGMAQLHGKESVAYARKLKVPVIKAVALSPDFDAERIARTLSGYPAKYFLLDRIKRGEGKRLDTDAVAELARHVPVLLAGGLDSKTVARAVRESGFLKGVDVAGGIETRGKQDVKKIRKFIREAKSV